MELAVMQVKANHCPGKVTGSLYLACLHLPKDVDLWLGLPSSYFQESVQCHVNSSSLVP